MIETNSASFMYAIADRRDWTIVECIRALVVLYPVGLWMLRWAVGERAPTVDDMISIVVALDRTQGHAALSGGAHRWRLSMLGSQEELERVSRLVRKVAVIFLSFNFFLSDLIGQKIR